MSPNPEILRNDKFAIAIGIQRVEYRFRQILVIDSPAVDELLSRQLSIIVGVHSLEDRLGLIGDDPIFNVLLFSDDPVVVRVGCSKDSLPRGAGQVTAIIDELIRGELSITVGIAEAEDAAVNRQLALFDVISSSGAEHGENLLWSSAADSQGQFVVFVALFLIAVAIFIAGAVTGSARLMAVAFVLTAALFLTRRSFLQ